MTTIKALELLLERTRNAIFEMSANYSMSAPKSGREKEWSTEKELEAILLELIADNTNEGGA